MPISSSQEKRTIDPQQSLDEDKVTEIVKNTDVLSKEVKTSIPGKYDQNLLSSFEYFMKHGHVLPISSPTTTIVIQSVTSP
jgi:hypothetical protein